MVLNGAYGKVEVDRARQTAAKHTNLFDRFDQSDPDRHVMACNVREAAYMRQLVDAPLEGVVRCVSVEVTDEGTIVGTMELGDCTLYDYMMSYQFEHRLEVFDEIFKQVTVGLAGMHRSGVVHGDLKTNNILRTCASPPTFKIIDFGGLSWTTLAQHHTSLCTYVTRAPELFVKGARPTAISDAWSLGATMLNFLTRKCIVEDGAPSNVTEHVRKQFEKGVRIRVPSSAPSHVREMIEGLLQEDPAKRWSVERVLLDYFRFFDAGKPTVRNTRAPTPVTNAPAAWRADLVRRARAMVSEREEWDAVPLMVSYVRRVYRDDFSGASTTQMADDLTAAYVLARAIVYDADTNLLKLTGAARERVVHMLRALDFDLASPARVAPLVVSVDGNIAASKSTVLDAVRRSGLPVDVVQEPVEEWEAILRLYYKDPSRWATALHADILTTYANIGRGVRRVTVIERSAWSCINVFQEMLFRDGVVSKEEHDIVAKLGRLAADYATPDVIVYMRCPPEECVRRKTKRARQCEQQLDASYMHGLHARYEEVMTAETCRRHGIHLVEVDASRPMDRVCADVVDVVRRLTEGDM